VTLVPGARFPFIRPSARLARASPKTPAAASFSAVHFDEGVNKATMTEALAGAGIGPALLGEFSVFRIKRNAIEKTVPCDTGQSFEQFDYLP
jgi:hypothetical protein